MTTPLIRLYSMYVIGEVESGWDWACIYRPDAITIGMMQHWGEEAAELLTRVKNDSDATDWNYLVANAPTLTNALNAHPYTDSWWEDKDLTDVEANALIHILSSTRNHAIQQQYWYDLCDRNVTKLLGWGMDESHPRELIFALNMYHQRPRSCKSVLSSVGALSNLDRLYAGAMNDSHFAVYKTRHTTVYNRLKAWNGVSTPPDFGQVQTLPNTTPDQGDTITSGVAAESMGHIIQQGESLILYGPAGSTKSNGVAFHPAAGQRWISGVSIPAPSVPDGSTRPEPAPSPTLDKLNAMVAWLVSIVGTKAYSQTISCRLNADNCSATDCSGLAHTAYDKFFGINVGTWTGEQKDRGVWVWSGDSSSPDYSKLRIGDLVFYQNSSGHIHHVEIYMGNDGPNAHKVIGHGGGMGPTIKRGINRYDSDGRVDIRRYV